jgi:hypothetical protein
MTEKPLAIKPHTSLHRLYRAYPFLEQWDPGYYEKWTTQVRWIKENPTSRARFLDRACYLCEQPDHADFEHGIYSPEKAAQRGSVPLDRFLDDIADEIERCTGTRPPVVHLADTQPLSTRLWEVYVEPLTRWFG